MRGERTHLVHMRHVLVQVIEAACHGEDRDSNEKDPGQAAHPGAIVQAIRGQEDCPHWQTALIQLQQPLIVLQGTIRCSLCMWAGRLPTLADRSHTTSAASHCSAGAKCCSLCMWAAAEHKGACCCCASPTRAADCVSTGIHLAHLHGTFVDHVAHMFSRGAHMQHVA